MQAQGHLRDSDERPNANAFSAFAGKPKYGNATPVFSATCPDTPMTNCTPAGQATVACPKISVKYPKMSQKIRQI